MAKVIVTISGRSLKEVHIAKDAPLSIGRDKTNVLRLDNPAVSRKHACIEKQGWPYYVVDFKSTNGTKVNGKPISGKMSLKHNDKVGIGKFVLVFRDDNGDDTKDDGLSGDTTITVS